MNAVTALPDHFPAYLRHSDDDTPIPTWKQVTRSEQSIDTKFAANVSRIVSGSEDEQVAIEVWEAWAGDCRRSVALLIDKIFHEGWLDSVGPIRGWPWDGGFFFWPLPGADELAQVLNAKSREDGGYIECTYRAGLTSLLAHWSHNAWKRSWVEDDSPLASLHIGLFKDGSAEVHLDLFNPLYVSGAPRSEITKLPLIGAYNHKLYRLHRRWDQAGYASIARTSANFYHLMHGIVPLSF